jgi:phosphoglucomutase
MTTISPLAGQPAQAAQLVDVDGLIDAYYRLKPDVAVPAQRVTFGTSGHRGCSLNASFNEAHVLAISQAIYDYRRQAGIDGPLFLGIDTHALSAPALQSTLEVLAANEVELRVAPPGDFTPTPAVSLAILTHNRANEGARADGILITPSHNPPEDGGFKYNPPHGGPADTQVTAWIEARANALLGGGLAEVQRVPIEAARHYVSSREYDFLGDYVEQLGSVIDFDVIRAKGVRMGVDPLGGAGVHYWRRIADRYGIDLTVISEEVDPRFGFMTLDWDGRIRMDPSSGYAMQRLVAARNRFDIAFACDTDHDRHGIVTRSVGLLPANHYLSVAVDYLFRWRTSWPSTAAVGKTLVSTAMIDRVTARLGRKLMEVPVGFKWFVSGLLDASLGFGGEESAGATCLRRDGSVWTTDKDGIVLALLSGEILARTGRDPGELYANLSRDLGQIDGDRSDAPASPDQKRRLSSLVPQQLTIRELAGAPVLQVLDRAPGNQGAIGGIKVMAASGWFAARPSGTENIYKIYAESFRGPETLKVILREAQQVVDQALGGE